MTRLSVLRHGPTAWNAEGRIQGRTDIVLSEAGRAEVASWRRPSLAAATIIMSSPLARAVETALILCRSSHPGDIALTTDPRLVEMSWGAWEGRLLTDLRRDLGPAFTDLESLGLDFRPDGGETPREVQSRALSFCSDVAIGERPVLAVAHKGVLRALLAAATGWTMIGKPPIAVRDATLYHFEITREGSISLADPPEPLAQISSRSRHGA